MRVAAEVFQRLLRAAERRLGVDNPFALAQRREEGLKGSLFLQRFDFAEKPELTFLKSLFKRFYKETAEQAR